LIEIENELVYGYGDGYGGENGDSPTYTAKRYTFTYSYTNSQGDSVGDSPL